MTRSSTTTTTTTTTTSPRPRRRTASAAARRAQRLTRGTWTSLVRLPVLCEALGVAMPRWARGLLEHAEVVARELPPDVVEPLTSSSTVGMALLIEPKARRWGLRMGLWTARQISAEIRQQKIDYGPWTAEQIDAMVVLTPFGALVQEMRRRDVPPPDPARPLTRPYQGPILPGSVPPVVEDGTPGLVVYKLEDLENGGIGPAWLIRGHREERLFRGDWVRYETAKQYAYEHGHRFEGGG